MRRRKFIKNSIGVMATQIALGGVNFKVKASEFAWMASKAVASNNNILVIIQLSGGNDGLNMLPPLDQMSKYLSLRPTIGLAENTILPLGTTGAGLHPVMTGMKGLYDDGNLLVVQGLSYPNQTFSHFAATQIWSAGINNTQESTGWMGRFLAQEYPTYPDDTFQDPIALQVEDLSTALFSSLNGTMSSSYNYQSLNSIIANARLASTDVYTDYLAFIQQQIQLSDTFSVRIKQAGALGANANSNYPNTTLANKLKVVAKLINGGLQTKVYHVILGGFDTHNSQLSRQSSLLTELSGALTAFQKDLLAMGNGIADRVAGMTFSEFGRRALENTSGGTDHGTSVPMFVFGTKLGKSKMIGTSPNLNNLTSNNLPMQYDYRQAYSAFLQQWLGLSSSLSDQVLLQTSSARLANARQAETFAPLPLFNTSANCQTCGTVNIQKN